MPAPVIDALRARVPQLKRAAVGAWRQLYVDAGGDHRDTTFLAGSGRGGTTWIAELINYDNAYRFMFEPFVARHVPEVRAYANRQYLRPGDDDPVFLAPAQRIVSGQIRNAWIDYYNHRVVATRRLIKDIRANLFLKWLHVHFPGMPIVLLIRHPLAVASSRFYHGWSNDLADFARDDRLMRDHLEPHRALIESVSDPFEKHVVQWCVENFVPLRQFVRGEIHVAFYENFSVEPRAELERLFAFLGKPFSERVLERVERPSRMTWALPGSRTVRTSDPEAWRPYVSAERLARALEIISGFGLDALYGDASLPNRAAADQLLGSNALGLKTQV